MFGGSDDRRTGQEGGTADPVTSPTPPRVKIGDHVPGGGLFCSAQEEKILPYVATSQAKITIYTHCSLTKLISKLSLIYIDSNDIIFKLIEARLDGKIREFDLQYFQFRENPLKYGVEKGGTFAHGTK